MKNYLLLFFVFSFANPFFSQNYQFKVLTSENTNLYPYIYAIDQDSLGYLWIGTGDGLFLYDGNSLTSFPLTFIAGDNFISAIAIHKDGTVFLGLNNGTVAYRKGKEFFLIKQ